MSRAAPGRPKQAAVPSGAEAGHGEPCELAVPAKGQRACPLRGLPDRPTYPSDEGLT
jgi:hypothetical protein